MRFSYATILAVIPLTIAAPLLSNPRGFVDDIKGAATEIGNLINSNATLSGVAGAVKQSVENPQLTVARVTVVKGLSDTGAALTQVGTQANATGNNGLTSLVATAQGGVSTAHQAINRIGDALVSGTKPSTDDQKAVAVGIKDTRTAVNQMNAAITTPDSTLSSNIADAVSKVGTLQEGGQGVLAASNLTFADLGLPDDFATS